VRPEARTGDIQEGVEFRQTGGANKKGWKSETGKGANHRQTGRGGSQKQEGVEVRDRKGWKLETGSDNVHACLKTFVAFNFDP
jgi:hypothetical protein